VESNLVEVLKDDASGADVLLLGDVDELDEEDETEEEDEEPIVQVQVTNPEKVPVLLPSKFDPEMMKQNGYEALLLQEKELREGQMTDALHSLRQSLGDKAWLLRNKLRNVKGTKARGSIRTGVMAKTRDVQKHVSAYNFGRQALLRMGLDGGWKPITKEDLRLSADIAEANRVGQNRDKLPWFWRIEDGPASGNEEINTGEQMEECRCNSLLIKTYLIFPVYRVNWLRAKARVGRWKEEGGLVHAEMDWSVDWFLTKKAIWENLFDLSKTAHQKAYAQKQMAQWDRFSIRFQKTFDWAKNNSRELRKRKRPPSDF
jgi:hypothetical protein